MFVLSLILVLKQQFIECNSIEIVTGKYEISREYDKGYMKIKFSSDYDLPLNKILKLQLSDLFLKKMVNTIHKFS